MRDPRWLLKLLFFLGEHLLFFGGLKDRPAFGLSDRPGELARAS